MSGGSATGYWQCVAVSATSDATGAYSLYAFGPYSQFNDYPKMGVWSDGYYVTFNMFTSTFQGAKVCAYDRASMLAGSPATQPAAAAPAYRSRAQARSSIRWPIA